MNTRRGILIFLGSMAVWGVAIYFLRPYLPDGEIAFFTFLAGLVATAIIAERFWRVEEPPMTWPQIGLFWTLMGMLALFLMWTPLPADEDLL
jgi:drug/metabolite transporter (DMT)-like permease